MADTHNDKGYNTAMVSRDNYSDTENQKELTLKDVTPKLTRWFF